MAPRRTLRAFTIVTIAAVLGGSVLGLVSTWRIYSNNVRLTRAYEVKAALAAVLAAITDAETGQRGYLITGDEGYLAPYRRGTAAIRRELSEVESLTQDDPELRTLSTALRAPVDRKLDELAQTVALRRERGFEAAQRVVETDVGQLTMDEIRATVATFDAAEERILARARTESLNRVRVAMFTGIGIATIAVGLVTAVVTLLLSRARELESKVRDRTADLEAANARLEAFAFAVAHDLRAPLRGVHGLAQALLEDYGARLDDTGRDFARRLVQEATSMDALIQDLLAYGRVSHVELAVTTVDLNEVVESSIHAIREDAAAAGARITVTPGLPIVSGNRSVLIQVFSNLISNAIKFGGREPIVAIRAERRDGMAHIWVEDQGIGIAPQHQDRIFGVFERLHGVESYPGTGIGLAIVRKGVERLGGRVGVESELGRGSRFWVELPAEAAA